MLSQCCGEKPKFTQKTTTNKILRVKVKRLKITCFVCKKVMAIETAYRTDDIMHFHLLAERKKMLFDQWNSQVREASGG
ncbi:MAG: hypothetical protein K0R66_1727 [Gammaproteobacteria bacterium]|jgi:hypothetical protein|nr:hypothetical protein [Gammaproteobacteria bacterium]